MSLLHTLQGLTKHRAKRVGRGYGSGIGGHTSGRGTKGHSARTGGKTPLWFEGGQLPLTKRLPWMRGKGRFSSLKVQQEVQLAAVVKKGLTTVTPEVLQQAGLIRAAHVPVRLVGAQKLEVVLTVEGVGMSAPVRAAIEQAGGSVTV